MKSKSFIIILLLGLLVCGGAFAIKTMMTKPLYGSWHGGIATPDRQSGGMKYMGSGNEQMILLRKDGTYEDQDAFQSGTWRQEGDKLIVTITQFYHRTMAENVAYFKKHTKGGELSQYRKERLEQNFKPIVFTIGNMNTELTRNDQGTYYIYHHSDSS